MDYCKEKEQIKYLFFSSPFVTNGLKKEGAVKEVEAKLRHIENVASMVEQSAREEGLSEKEVLMAFTAGQFHDIACVGDIWLTEKEYGPLHGSRGGYDACGILFMNYDGFSGDEIKTIVKVIRNHDGPTILEDLEGLSLTIALLLRDCDKVDCYRRQATEPLQTVFQRPLEFDAPIRKDWAEDCLAGKPMLYSDMKNFNEEALLYLGWFFQLKKKSCQRVAFPFFVKLAFRIIDVTEDKETALYAEKAMAKAKELINLD